MHDHPIQQKQLDSSKAEHSSPEMEGKSLAPPAFQLMASNGSDAPPVQRKQSSGGLPGDLVDGFAASTGHDLSDVKVHSNSDKPSQVGALAYAQGNDIHLGSGQEQHLAHEAAHIVQQREGRVQANTNVGGMPVNDQASLESEADSMGAKAAQMKSSATASPLQRKSPGVVTQKKAIQRKAASNVMQLYADVNVAAQTAREWQAGVDVRVADNGRTLTSVDHGSKICYAHPSLIAQSNRELAARNSGIVLVEQAQSLRGSAPDGSGRHTLKKVLPTISHSTSGGAGTGQSSWQDCGRMSREVMGHSGADQAPHGIVENPGGDLIETAASYDPAAQRDNALMAAGLGATPAAALAAYRAMDPAARATFDQQHGLNRYAAPGVGEAFSVQNANGFNFHWGGVILTPGGGDRVTLENFAKGGGYAAQDQSWYF
ncbi:MAG TPA: DUF4157 domain-containing protein, partial [Bacteroidia bacterium]|nr:DUF4157 domain-containing protein [Bacteroidia bacterium]